DILPKTVIKAAKEKSIGISEIPEAMMTRIRLIPTRTATGEGLMLAVKADKIIISDKKSEREVNALLAVCELGNSADGCQALLPTELMI
ncbi:MAG: sigma-E processing peptidase SpoIIGA, partial [Clostridia bacterium]|nr:sigma-E processing peptidase SpoIIGA [Clostridia bacterium]